MEDKNRNTGVIFPNDNGTQTPASLGMPQANTPPQGQNGVVVSSQALSADPGSQTLVTQQQGIQPKKTKNLFLRLIKRADVILVLLLLLGGLGLFLQARFSDDGRGLDTATNRFGITQIPLQDIIDESGGLGDISFDSQTVTINGALYLNSGVVIAPSPQPLNAVSGQLYYDQSSNVLNYYNGTEFVPLTGAETEVQVQGIGGLTGQVVLGAGLNTAGGQLQNSGVLSIQGVAGNVTLNAGNGIAINGTTISNTGVVSVSSSSPAIIVADDGNGNIVLTGASGTATVSSSGGTAGRIPVFTGSQNIEDSIITQSGMTVTITGDLAVVTGGLSLSNALTVSNGGTGATSFAANGVLIGNGTAAISAVTAGGPNLCLVSTAGAPVFTTCPSSAGVTTVNGQSGAVTIANASGAGGIVTIDNASTSAKGIAQFNGTNFSDDGAGTINTIQDINSGATPTFAGVNTNNITPSGMLTVGAAAQQLILQGNASIQLAASGGGFTTTVGFTGTPTGDVIYNFDRSAAAGTYTICTSVGNCAGTGGMIGGGGTVNRLSKFTPDGNNIGDSTISDDGSTVTTSVDMVIQGGNLTIGTLSQSASLVLHDGNGQSTTLQAGDSSGDLTFVLPGGVGTQFQCLKKGSGNQLIWDDCTGGTGGGGVTSINNLTGSLTLQGTANQIVLTDNGSDTITIGTPQDIAITSSPTFAGLTLSGDLAVNGGDITSTGALNITPGGTLTVGNNLNLTSGSQYQINGVQISSANLSNDSNLAKLNASQTFTGDNNTFRNGVNSTNGFSIQNADGVSLLTADTTSGQIVLGTGSTLDGRLIFNNSANNFAVAIVSDSLTNNRTIQLPDADGIICLDTGNCAGAGATLQTAYNFSTGGTVPKIKVNDTLLGVDIQDADITIGANLFNVRASDSGGLGSVMFGVGNTGQITLQNSVNSTTALRLLTQGGTSVLTGDTTNGRIILGQSNTLSGSLVFNNASNSNTTTIDVAAPSTNQTITLPDSSGTVCLTSGNCMGTGGVGDVLQGGNSFGTGMVIGTNDANSLGLETSGATRLTIAADGSSITSASGTSLVVQGASLFQNATDSTTALQVQNSSGSAVFDVDTTNGRVGIGTAAPERPLDLVINNSSVGTPAFRVLQQGSGHSSMEFSTPTGSFYMGMDSGAGGMFRISSSAAAASGAMGGWSGTPDFTFNNYANMLVASKVLAPISGSVSSISMYAGTVSGGSPGGRVALYADNAGEPGALIVSADQQNLSPNTYNTFAIPSTSVTAGTNYWLVGIVQANATRLGTWPSGGYGVRDFSGSFPTMPATLTGQTPAYSAAIERYSMNMPITPASGEVNTFGNTSLLSMTDSGAFTLKNNSNSTAAFRVLNTASVPLFTIDTENSIIYVGNLVDDNIGAVLVLDTSTSSSDPTGINGAMYYSTSRNGFRCYQTSSGWQDCMGIPRPNNRRISYLAPTGANTTWSGTGDSVVATGTASFSSGSFASSPQIRYATTATANNVAGVLGTAVYAFTAGNTILYQSGVYLDSSAATSMRIWSGVTDQTLATMGGSATPAGNYAAFRRDTSVAGETTYKCVTSDGSSRTIVDTGIAGIAGPRRLEVDLSWTRAIFKINGLVVCDITTTLPSTNIGYKIVNSVTTLTTASRQIWLEWIYVENEIR